MKPVYLARRLELTERGIVASEPIAVAHDAILQRISIGNILPSAIGTVLLIPAQLLGSILIVNKALNLFEQVSVPNQLFVTEYCSQ